MRLFNDVDHSDPVGLSSLGVVDLDLAIVPDVFGLRDFDSAKPITQMLPGQFPNKLRVLIPGLGIAPDGFHDIVIFYLSATPAWRSSRLIPGDVTSLRWRWNGSCFVQCTSARRKWRLSVANVGIGWSGSSVRGIRAIAPGVTNTSRLHWIDI